MPSFFEGLKRIIQGKPLFDATEDQHNPPAPSTHQQPVPPSMPEPHQGPKILPRVFIEETDCREHGGRLECDGMIRNESDRNIYLDKVRLLGAARELDTTLRPGERRQFLLYSGPFPQSASNHICELQYRDETGDYFTGLHNVEMQHNGQIFVIRHIRYQGIKDI